MAEQAMKKYDYGGREETGFYAVLTDSYMLVPPGFDSGIETEGLKVVESKISGTDLVGLFCVGNSNSLLVPREITDIEEDSLSDSEIDYSVLDSRYNALGNLILCNDKGALISPKIEDYREEVAEALDVEVKVGEIAGCNPGVSGVANSKGVVVHREASEEDVRMVKEALKVEEADIGTINMGSPYMGSGCVVNDSEMIVGHSTTGPEIGRLDRNLF